MKIKFGTVMKTHPMVTVFFFGGLGFAINCFNAYLLTLFGQSEKSILLSRKLNVTYKTDTFYCDLPYDNCLCSVLLNKSHISENCISYDQLVISRILPLTSFFLQIFLVRELFSLITDHRHVIIYALWIAAIFILISMIISIYWSSCYQVYITTTLLLTGGLLLYLSLYNVLYNPDRDPSSSNRNKNIMAHSSERTNNAYKSLFELL